MIKILTDGCANLPGKILKKYDIDIISLNLLVDDREICPQSKEFNIHDFYKDLRDGKKITTSLANIEAYTEFFTDALLDSDGFIYIGMSSGISGTVTCAKFALDIIKEKFPGKKTAVIDSLCASLGEGLVVIYAAELIKSGTDFEKTVALTEEYKKSVHQLFTVDDLKYLRRGGRLSSAKAVIGSVLNIKPILKGDESGKIVLSCCVRGSNAALEKLCSLYLETNTDKTKPVCIAHCDNEKRANTLLKMLRKVGFKGNCITEPYEAVTGSHVGPDTVALFF